MSDLKNLGNIYADLAQGAYHGRTFGDENISFPDLQAANGNNDKYNQTMLEGAKDAHGNEIPGVYLQSETSNMSDKNAGFNSYFLTNNEELNQDTQHTYFAIRGSDGDFAKNSNDWVDNDLNFAVNSNYIPQAKLATAAIDQKIKEMASKSPNATISVTGHSLGTMISIQGVANLPADSINKVDRVVLFDGPDARSSIDKMSAQARANIEKLESEGKIDYYVNPFDIVSMLNRNKPGVDEIGNVHYLWPNSVSSTMDGNSAHDFGQIHINADGSPREATLKKHPEFIAAGMKISNVLNPLVAGLKSYLGDVLGDDDQVSKLAGDVLIAFAKKGKSAAIAVLSVAGVSDEGILVILATVGVAYVQYNSIINDAKEASNFGKDVSSLKDKISKSSDYNETLSLEAELAGLISKHAESLVDEYSTIYKDYVQEYEDEVDQIVTDVHNGAYSIKHYLSDSEVFGLIADFTKPSLWDGSKKSKDDGEVTKYNKKVRHFATELDNFSGDVALFDQEKADNIERSNYLTGKNAIKSKGK